MSESAQQDNLRLEVAKTLPTLKENIVTEVLNAYAEPWRTFHNVTYITKMFSILNNSALPIRQITELAAMTFFHRYVYKFSYSGHGTLKSAKYAKNQLISNGFSPEFSQAVYMGISFTSEKDQNVKISSVLPSKHRSVVGWFNDIYWLTRLGRNEGEFLDNIKKIAEEKLPILSLEAAIQESRNELQNIMIRRNLFLNKSFREYGPIIKKYVKQFLNGKLEP